MILNKSKTISNKLNYEMMTLDSCLLGGEGTYDMTNYTFGKTLLKVKTSAEEKKNLSWSLGREYLRSRLIEDCGIYKESYLSIIFLIFNL